MLSYILKCNKFTVFSPYFLYFLHFKMKHRRFLFAVLVKNLHFKMKQTNFSCYFWFIFIFRNNKL